MQTESRAEVVLCPNCKEEVPKTLYCLNCGYPLYKIEMAESTPKESEDITIEIDSDPYSIQPLLKHVEETTVQEEELPVPVVEIETGDVMLEPDSSVENVDDAREFAVPELVDQEMVQEPVPERSDVQREKEIIVVPQVVEADVSDTVVVHQVDIVEEEETVVSEVAQEAEEVAEKKEYEPLRVTEPESVFVPDPVVVEVMENLVKNISMKIKLVGLFKGGEVKFETFNRLFESYIARGELYMNSRNEMMERVRYDLDSREKALNEAKIGLEELKIRRSIGDVSEEEFMAKSPGFEWDIGQYEDDVDRKKAEIGYLVNITQVIPEGKVMELVGMAEDGLGSLEGLVESGVIDSEVASRVRAVLDEALSFMGSG
jgi:hypothetical protein